MTLIEAAREALQVLENIHGGCTDSNDGTFEAITVWCPGVIDALTAALAAEVGVTSTTPNLACKSVQARLVEQWGYEKPQHEYPLPDSLYPGSKDWVQGSYAERVAWLHAMYEARKSDVDSLFETWGGMLAAAPEYKP